MSRDKVIIKTSIVGILTNILLAAFKTVVGIVSNTIAVILDAVNNLYHSMNELKTVVDDYIYFFNNMRPHKRLKNMTPVEYETEYYKKISEDKLDDCIPY